MRETGLEPARYCYHQPLKLARLPISPLARGSLPVVNLRFRRITVKPQWSRDGELPPRLNSLPGSLPTVNRQKTPAHPRIAAECESRSQPPTTRSAADRICRSIRL